MKKLKRFIVYVKTNKGFRSRGQELAYSKTNATKNIKKRYGKTAYVKQIKY